ELTAVIDRMMAKAADDRFQTPEELAAALEPFVQTPIPPPPAEEMPQLCLAAAGPNSMGPSSNSPSSSRKILQGNTLSHAVRTAPSTPLPRKTLPRSPASDDALTEIIPGDLLAPPDDSDDKRRRRAFLLLAIGGGLILVGSLSGAVIASVLFFRSPEPSA